MMSISGAFTDLECTTVDAERLSSTGQLTAANSSILLKHVLLSSSLTCTLLLQPSSTSSMILLRHRRRFCACLQPCLLRCVVSKEFSPSSSAAGPQQHSMRHGTHIDTRSNILPFGLSCGYVDSLRIFPPSTRPLLLLFKLFLDLIPILKPIWGKS